MEQKYLLRGHTELNHGPLDLQSNALPLSYTPQLNVNVINKGTTNIHALVSCPCFMSTSINIHQSHLKLHQPVNIKVAIL